MSNVRVRFAPSPTGFLHIGGLRTALYNYLFAKHHDGEFILRIEDTDQSRYVEEAEQDIIDSLLWSGIEYDEGPGREGEVGPYRQSERKEMYMKYAKQLVENDYAYYAFDTPEEIDQMRERLKKSGNPSPKYDAVTRQSMKNSLTLPQDEVEKKLEAGDEFIIRLKVPRRETIRFEDEIRGHVSFEAKGLDDQVLIKSDGMPTYHMANVVDDHLMKISHVIRGEEWLSSAPKHILLYKYLGWEPPKMAHLPLIMSPSGGKLSKRKAESQGIMINTRDYKEQLYEPEALVNFLAFLGWNPGDDRELLSMDELISEFTLDRVSKGGAVFNKKKLMWYNEHYLREEPTAKLLPRVKEIAEEHGYTGFDDPYFTSVIDLMKDRISLVTEFVTLGSFFFEDPTEYDEKALKKWKDDSSTYVASYLGRLKNTDEDDYQAGPLKETLKEVLEEYDIGFGKLMMPLRIAITGMGFGPDLFGTMELLGKEIIIRRLETALEKLG
jgi:glutamyl-tRNA synthetase